MDTVPQAVNILPRVINKEAVKFIFERVVSNIGIRSLSVAIRQYCL